MVAVTTLKFTKHAKCRMQQRGFRPEDLILISRYATSVSDGLMLREKDVRWAIQCIKDDMNTGWYNINEAKRMIQKLERLCNTVLIIVRGEILTCYKARKKTQKKKLRNSRRGH